MAVVETDLLRRQVYAAGRWVDADSGGTFPVIDPATGDAIAEKTRRAIEAAQEALPAWRAQTA